MRGFLNMSFIAMGLTLFVMPTTGLPNFRGNKTDHACSTRAGCYNGNCRMSCTATGVGEEWCYTTKGSSLDGGYISCTIDTDCGACLKCAGACTI